MRGDRGAAPRRRGAAAGADGQRRDPRRRRRARGASTSMASSSISPPREPAPADTRRRSAATTRPARGWPWRLTCSRCFPSGSRGSRASATSPTRSRRARAGVRQHPRPHAAERRPGRRHALRRGRRHGAARRRRGERATRALRGRPAELLPQPARDRAGARRAVLDDALVDELAAEPALTLLCGRYEGFDERILEHFCSDVVSIGRYVLSGGELAAMVVCDAVAAQAARRTRRRALGRRGVLQRGPGGQPGVPPLHAPRRASRLEGCPRSCSPATTGESRSGACSAAASRAARSERSRGRSRH